MPELSASSLLSVWERGLSCPLPLRALMLLGAACPEEPREELVRLPIGERDARLLALRESAFGPELESVVACPACGETLELCPSVSDLRLPGDSGVPETLAVSSGEFDVRFRLPDSGDLIAVEDAADGESGRRVLLERCLVEVRRGEGEVEPGELPEEAVLAISAAMEEADPGGNLELALTCPECAHRWRSPFDIAPYLWAEIDAWARRTLGEVHALASAYGWSEAEVLDLSARRRQLYLEQIGR